MEEKERKELGELRDSLKEMGADLERKAKNHPLYPQFQAGSSDEKFKLGTLMGARNAIVGTWDRLNKFLKENK